MGFFEHKQTMILPNLQSTYFPNTLKMFNLFDSALIMNYVVLKLRRLY